MLLEKMALKVSYEQWITVETVPQIISWAHVFFQVPIYTGLNWRNAMTKCEIVGP